MYNINLMLNIPLYKYKTEQEAIVAGRHSGCSISSMQVIFTSSHHRQLTDAFDVFTYKIMKNLLIFCIETL